MSFRQLLLAAIFAALLLILTIQGAESDLIARRIDWSPLQLTISMARALGDTLYLREHIQGIDPLSPASDLVNGRFSYYAPVVFGRAHGLNSWLVIQNLGSNPAITELWFRSRAECVRSLIADDLHLLPGETRRFDVGRMPGPGFEGSVWIRTSSPVSVAVEHEGLEVRMGYTALPPPPGDSPAVSGPLLYQSNATWDALLTVQNLSSLVNARVQVSFLDEDGQPVTRIVNWICPRGTEFFYVPLPPEPGGTQVRSVRIESQGWWSTHDTEQTVPGVAAVAHLLQYDGPARGVIVDALAYSLLPGK